MQGFDRKNTKEAALMCRLFCMVGTITKDVRHVAQTGGTYGVPVWAKGAGGHSPRGCIAVPEQ
ncbi:hypothetical protein ASY01nite_13360 [Acetobacter syzygii]|nr:hypothetical protein Absy_100_115 [Acetobacter syzygii]GBR66588.1 hypothetical protein AA0483_2395 [Acetobacter syzygii NRIC 0483]GEL56270.1 hypothetical protein ASY01nite_13360 [Acetobacter syzygii]